MEPFGEERADLRAALVGAKIVNALTGQDQDLDDFIFDFQPKPEGPVDSRSSLERLAAALGAEVVHDS